MGKTSTLGPIVKVMNHILYTFYKITFVLLLISVHKLEKTNFLGLEALAFALQRTSQANMENSLRIDLIKMQSLAMNNVTAKCSFFEI